MDTRIPTGQLAEEIRRIYRSDMKQAETLIEAHLEEKLMGLSVGSRPVLLQKLSEGFDADSAVVPDNEDMEDDALSRVFSLLLGREVPRADLTSSEALQRLAGSINTIFDALNQLIGVINMTLSPENSGDETIRFVIGSQLEEGGEKNSLESYLGQIQKAFLRTQQAFKNAAYVRMEEVLSELDPEKISAAIGGLKFGPLRKAECFDIYEKKYLSCKKWFESGRFMEAFVQEFEKSCQRLSGSAS